MDLGDLIKPLMGVFVVATIMESALATIFNWRLYREFFDGRAMKTLVMIAVGWAVVKYFHYDVFKNIVKVAGGEAANGDILISEPLSALVLAGGSAAIYELFKTLGLRPPAEPPIQKQPPEDKAWVSVKIVRKSAVGDISIHIDPLTNPTEAEKATPPLAGVLSPKADIWDRIVKVFFADRGRLPMYGGKTVDAGDRVYRILATGCRTSDDPGGGEQSFEKEIYTGRFAGRAIIDFTKVI